MKAKVQQAWMITVVILSIFLLIVVGILEAIPVTNSNNDLVVLQQANFQLARAEFMIKDVFALAYRPATSHAQAISELQIQLPVFQRTQEGLANGDPSLGLPNNPSSGVKAALLDAQPDYLAITTAVSKILAHPDSAPDQAQVDIVAQHERPYISAMYPVVVLLQQEAQARIVLLLVLKMTLLGVVVVLVLLKYLLFTQRVIRKMIEEEAAAERKEHPP